MGDLLGTILILVLIVGAAFGLKILSRPQTRTSEEFERNAAEGTTAMGASMNALQELMDPAAAKSKEVITQVKERRFQKKKRDGKAVGSSEEEIEGAPQR